MLNSKIPENYIKYCIIKENKVVLGRLQNICEQYSMFISTEVLKKMGFSGVDIDRVIKHYGVLGPGPGTDSYRFEFQKIRNKIEELCIEFYKSYTYKGWIFNMEASIESISTGLELLRLDRKGSITSTWLSDLFYNNLDTIKCYLWEYLSSRAQLVLDAYNHPIFGGIKLPKYIDLGIGSDIRFISEALGRPLSWKELEQRSPDLYNQALEFVGRGSSVDVEIDEIKVIMNS